MTVSMIVRLKNVATINDETLDETTGPEYIFEYLDVGSVGRGHLVTQPEKVTFADAPTRARRRVRAGDTIVSTVRTYLRAILPITRELSEVIVSTGFAVIRPRPIIDSRFLGWALQGDRFVEEVVSRSTGVSYPTIAPSSMADIKVSIPEDRHQQSLVADFLDRATRRIDALADAKRRMVDLLEEKREALTLAAATGGFDRHPARKPSLPWAQSLPTHWREALLNKVARMGSGHTPSRDHPEWWENTTIPWVTTGEVQQVRDDRIEYLTSTRERISLAGLANSAAVLHPKDTVFLSRTAASAGFSGIMSAEMATSQDLVTWTCGPEIQARFLLLCLRAMRKDLLERLAQGSTHKTIYMPDISSIKVPLPPLEEQQSIVERFWRAVSPIDATVDLLTDQVDLLVEYRQALITQAVTGQLDEATLKGAKPVNEAVAVMPE